LSRPTINEVLGVLFATGYLIEDEPDIGQRSFRSGPAPRMLRFAAEVGHVCGIDIGAEKILVKLARLDGEVVASVRVATPRLSTPAETIRRVRNAVRIACTEAGIGEVEVRQAAVSTPGIVDPSTGCVFLAPQLRGWEGLRLADRLALQCPVVVENEMHLAVLGERWRGAAKGIDDVVYIGLGVGIGAGVVLGGRLHRGLGGAAGEIGYLPLTVDADAVTGGRGAFETAAGAHALGARAQKLARGRNGGLLRELAGGDPTEVTAATLFAAASAGDAAAATLISDEAKLLAHAIATVALVLAPSVVIIGGGLSRAGALLLDPIQERLPALLPVPPPQVLQSTLGEDAATIGAIYVALQITDDRLYTTVAGGER